MLWRRVSVVLLLVGAATSLAAQDLRLVTVTRTPFSQVESGQDTGFAIELWAAIADELNLAYSIDRKNSFPEMLQAIRNGDADIAAANISITADRETVMDFSQPIFASGLRVMVHAGQERASVFSVLWSKDLLLAVLGAVVLLLGGGMLMWGFERRSQEYFDGDAQEKLFPSFWWALNLVVNGGFEERVPRTALGRIFATILVISSLFIVSIFVAHITAAMTVDAIQSSVQGVNDLYGKRVGTTAGSTASTYLDQRDLQHQGFDDLETLLAAFEADELDAVVFDAPILSYYVNTDGAGVGELVGSVFLRENYGFGLQTGSELREPINRVLLRFAEDGTYRALYVKWFGTDGAR
ncbi:MAG: transporter substrate-binding domain-containing protein [Silicimonas sp.]|nr:transporter substrate-binding domain-containing protein [Silicimonas sp.]